MNSRPPATRTLVAAAIAVVVTVAGLGVALILRDRMGPRPTPSTRSPSTVPSQTMSPPTTAAFDDFGFALGTGPRSPTAARAESKLWHHDGDWWGVLAAPESGDFHIFRLDRASQTWLDTGVIVDTRDRAEPDVLSDGDTLYVVSGISSEARGSRPRLLRYAYQPDRRSWDLDRNFPVDLAANGLPSLSLAKDSTGRLWLAWAGLGAVMVSHSLTDDLLWAESFRLPVDGADGLAVDDIAALVPYGAGRIGLMWTDKTNQRVLFATHHDDEPSATWAVETVMEGRQLVGSQLQVKAATRRDEPTVVAVIRTSQDEGTGTNAQAPLLVFVVRKPDATWETYLVSRVQDRHNKPILVVDEAAHVVHILATAPGGGGAIHHKLSPLDAIAFDVGRGEPLIGPPGGRIVDATSTKQAVGPETGLVVVAWDEARERYVHAVVDVGDHPPLSRPAAASPSPSPSGAAPVANDVIDDDFNPWPVGINVASGWSVRSDDPALVFQILDGPTPEDHVAGVRTTLASDTPRACKGLGVVTAGTLTVDARVRLGGLGASDGTVTSIRGPGGEAVAVRFGQGGTFAYYAGATKVRTVVPFRAGAWYRSTVVVNLAARTYAWELRADGATATLVAVSGIPWRVDGPSLDELCFATSSGRPGLDISFDDVSARQ